MNKELIDRVWACLPREFKEEVKYEYTRVTTKGTKDSYDLGFMHAHEGMFGHHNLTSDAEGEEMLTVSRKEIQQLVAVNDKLIKKHPGRNSIKAIQAKTVNTILNRLFGSKCLPDNIATSESNVDSLDGNVDSSRGNVDSFEYLEPKANGYTPIPEKTYLSKWNKTEQKPAGPEEKTSEKRVENKQSRNLSQSMSNCDKRFDNILKDSFSRDRMLNIAVQIMSGILSNQKMLNNLASGETTAEGVVKSIVDATIMYTDALIARTQRGGKYGED